MLKCSIAMFDYERELRRLFRGDPLSHPTLLGRSGSNVRCDPHRDLEAT